MKKNLFRTTFHLCLSILDRFLHFSTSAQKNLQTVGTAALLLAAKLEEVVPPDIYKLVDFGDGAVDIQNLIKIVRSIPIQFKKITKFSGGCNLSHSQMENQFCNSITVFAPISPIANSDFDKTLDAQLQFNFAFLFLNSSGYNQTGFTFLYLSIPYHFSRHYNSGKKL